MSDQKIIRLSPSPEHFGEEPDELEADMFESAIPTQHSHSDFENDDIGLYIGVWDTTDMIEAAGQYECDEFMLVLEGEVVIKNNTTNALTTVVAGEAFVIPKGLDCQWQQKGYLRKFYVISEHPDEAVPSCPTINDVIIIKADELSVSDLSATDDGHLKKEYYIDHTKRFSAGIWQGKTLKTEQTAFPHNEFLVINDGSLICIDENSKAHTFNQGDALFIPQGTLCAWEVKDQVTITYAKIKQ